MQGSGGDEICTLSMRQCSRSSQVPSPISRDDVWASATRRLKTQCTNHWRTLTDARQRLRRRYASGFRANFRQGRAA
jgi:hypothetical protein